MEPAKVPILFSNDEYEIRPATSLDEFRQMWWGFMQDLGWDRGYYDLETYMNPSDGYGMLLLIEKASKAPVGHVSAVINSNSTGWVSMFIIDEAHRGKGMGRELFKIALADFERKGTRIRGLDAVPAQKETYRRRDFVESPLGELKILVRKLAANLPMQLQPHEGHLVDLRKIPYDLLVQHELQYTGFERRKLWNDENMFNRPDVLGLALVDRPSPQNVNDIRAWAMIRRCSQGVRLGPLYASSASDASAILAEVVNLATPEYIKSLPLPNEAMNDWTLEEIATKATITVEVWTGNPESLSLFESNAWISVGAGFSIAHRMWIGGEATPEHCEGGLAQKGVFAIFDAAVG